MSIHFNQQTESIHTGSHRLTMDITGSFDLPVGRVFQRPEKPRPGSIRYNSDVGGMEIWGPNGWEIVTGPSTTFATKEGLGIVSGSEEERPRVIRGPILWFNKSTNALEFFDGDHWFVLTGSKSIFAQKSGDTMVGKFDVQSDSAEKPGLTFGDAKTGIFSPDLGKLAFSVNGTRQMMIDSDGSLRLNVPLPVTSGGTGAIDPDTARSNLGLGNAAIRHIGSGDDNVPSCLELRATSNPNLGDALIGYHSNMSGSKGSTVDKRLSGLPLDLVIDFGCDNTGQFNCAVEFKNALDAAKEFDRPLYVPRGIYNIGDASFTLPHGLALIGNRSTFMRTVTINSPIFTATKAGMIKISGVDFHYNTEQATAPDQAAIHLAGCWDVSISDCNINGPIYHGFHIVNSRAIRINDFWIKGCGNTAIALIDDEKFNDLGRLGDVRITEGRVNAVLENAALTSRGIVMSSIGGHVQDILVANVVIEKVKEVGVAIMGRIVRPMIHNVMVRESLENGFAAYPYFGRSPMDVDINNCAAERCRTGFDMVDIYSAAISNSRAAFCHGNGFGVLSATNLLLSGCQSSCNMGRGFSIDNCESVILGGCIGTENNQAGLHVWKSTYQDVGSIWSRNKPDKEEI